MSAFVICLDEEEPCHLSMSTSSRFKGNTVHAGNFTTHFFSNVPYRQTTLRTLFILQRMNSSKAFKRSHGIVHFRIIFHGAATKGVRSVIHAMRMLRQFSKVTAYVIFRHFGKSKRNRPSAFRKHNRHITFRQFCATSAFYTFFKDELHFVV